MKPSQIIEEAAINLAKERIQKKGARLSPLDTDSLVPYPMEWLSAILDYLDDNHQTI
jgi:hypothetical protein